MEADINTKYSHACWYQPASASGQQQQVAGGLANWWMRLLQVNLSDVRSPRNEHIYSTTAAGRRDRDSQERASHDSTEIPHTPRYSAGTHTYSTSHTPHPQLILIYIIITIIIITTHHAPAPRETDTVLGTWYCTSPTGFGLPARI